MSATVARARKPTPRWLRILIGWAVIAAAVAFLVWMFGGAVSYLIWGSTDEAVMVSVLPGNFSMGSPLPPPPATTTRPEEKPTPTAQQAAPVPAPVPPPPAAAVNVPRPMIVWRASTAILAGSEAIAKKASASPDNDEEVGSTGSAKDSAYAKDLMATRIEDARPKRHRYPSRFTIKKGTKFHCTVPEPIDTQLPGPLDCDVDAPGVYSMDSNTLLIPPHSTVHGMIEHGLGAGQDRAVVVMTDVLTTGPDFYPIPLGYSSGASDLGQTGIPVDVDPHTWDKIKTALMFATIQGGVSILTAAAQSHGGSNQYNIGGPVGTAGSSLAQIAMERDYNIPTTGHRSQARTMLVYVNQYIDLSDWYDLTLRTGR